MNRTTIARQYIAYLEAGDRAGILSLFAEMSSVDSPIYGVRHPVDFYETLSQDTQHSKLSIQGIFEEPGSDRLALYFNYQWTLSNGKLVDFDVVDILRFDDEDRIVELKIIYDTVVSRKLVGEMRA